MIHVVLFEAELKRCHDHKIINDRQYSIVNEVLEKGEATEVDEMRNAVWYKALYNRLTPKTRSRDLKQLLSLELLSNDKDGNIVPGFVKVGDS